MKVKRDVWLKVPCGGVVIRTIVLQSEDLGSIISSSQTKTPKD